MAAWAPIDVVQAAGNAVEGPQLRRRQMRAMALDMARAVDAHDVGHATAQRGFNIHHRGSVLEQVEWAHGPGDDVARHVVISKRPNDSPVTEARLHHAEIDTGLEHMGRMAVPQDPVHMWHRDIAEE